MKIVVAPQAFKGSLTAPEATEAIARGVRQVFGRAELVLLPVADGGEGTVRALVRARGGRLVTSRVRGPLGEPVNALWGLIGDGAEAVIEMAEASGLTLIRRDERNPLRTSTVGTGELIREALNAGARNILIGVGGSATNDGGMGMAEALGVRFLDASGDPLPPSGSTLDQIDRIDTTGMDPRIQNVEVVAAVDVTNPLCGPEGASAVYGPQKGATGEMVRRLDEGLAHYAAVIRRDLGVEVAELPGAGAAGGLAAGLVAFLGAQLRPGVEVIFRAIDIEARLRGAAFVITGEGRMDRQDIYGKAPLAVAKHARNLGIPTIAIVGSTGRDYRIVFDHGIDAVIGIVNRPMPLDRALTESSRLLTEAAMRACRLIRVGMRVERNRKQDYNSGQA